MYRNKAIWMLFPVFCFHLFEGVLIDKNYPCPVCNPLFLGFVQSAIATLVVSVDQCVSMVPWKGLSDDPAADHPGNTRTKSSDVEDAGGFLIPCLLGGREGA